MKNREIAEIFRNIAQLLELKEDNPFRIRAYLRAAENLEGLADDVAKIARKGKLEEIPGIGRDLALKIKELIKTKKLKYYEVLKREMPAGLLELCAVPGIGPKTAKLLYEKLNIKDISSLERMAKAHKISKLPGIKEKTEENILRGVELVKRGRERMPLSVALSLAEEVAAGLKTGSLKRIEPAGSLRRQKETIRDIDILAVSSTPKKVMERFTRLPQVREILAKGNTKSSVRIGEGVEVDLRVVPSASYGAALMYFTGSKAHNIHLRKMAVQKGWKINEYGVFKGKKRIAGESEKEIYKLLGLPYIEPELREDRGEIEAGLKGKIPRLVELADIKGDLHAHSRWTDGASDIEEVARRARAKGYQYIAICDHSQSLKVTGGLTPEDLKRQRKEIEKVNKKLKGFHVLSGSEVDITSNGSLDFPDKVLKELDIVIAAIHTGFTQSGKMLTERIIKAIENPYVDIIAHPTGRLMGVRDPYPVDMERIIEAAAKTGTYLEINAYPYRLDLDDINCRKAKEKGARLVVSTDTHILSQLDTMRFGIAVARRGWLEKKDLLNTSTYTELIKKLKK